MATFTSEPIVPNKLVLLEAGAITVPWAEFISKGGSLQEGSRTVDQSRETICYQVGWEDEPEAIKSILGYPSCPGIDENTGEPNKKLSRIVPLEHPRYPWLRATAIPKITRVKFTGKEPVGPIAKYKFSYLTTLFTSLPYNAMSDENLGTLYGQPLCEAFRYTTWVPVQSSQVLTRDRGAFKWVETSPRFPIEGPTVGAIYPSSVGQFLSKPTIHVKWLQVPAQYVTDANGLPTNLLACENKVNSTVFPKSSPGALFPITGYPVGTILFKTYKLTPSMPVIGPADLGVSQWLAPRCFDVDLVFEYFNPITDGPTKGHRLMPYFNNGNWYRVASAATAADAAAGKYTDILGSADLNTIFQHV